MDFVILLEINTLLSAVHMYTITDVRFWIICGHITHSTYVALRPMGEMLIMPFLNSIKVPLNRIRHRQIKSNQKGESQRLSHKLG